MPIDRRPSVLVPVMSIRIVGVPMLHAFMLVWVGVWFTRRITGGVFMHRQFRE